MSAWRVKPLDWRGWTAKTPFGEWLIWQSSYSGDWYWARAHHTGALAGTKEAAKAAAQADFAGRVADCIESAEP